MDPSAKSACTHDKVSILDEASNNHTADCNYSEDVDGEFGACLSDEDNCASNEGDKALTDKSTGSTKKWYNLTSAATGIGLAGSEALSESDMSNASDVSV